MDIRVRAGAELSGNLLELNPTSAFLGQKRGVHVYLPPSYQTKSRHYPVLYLHDGQNVFSSAGAGIAFGWGSWELDQTVDALCRDGRMQEIIMVAVDGSPRRMEEYNGLESHGVASSRTAFENYEAFLITELKPQVDAEFRTLPGAAHTATMGSSMGGVCSLALAWYHPEVFGGAASLSGAFKAEYTDLLSSVIENYRGASKPFRVYLDSGVIDFMGGDDGRSKTKQVVANLQRIGWASKDLLWFVDEKTLTRTELARSSLNDEKRAEAQRNQHNEFYWRRRAWRALTFLFPPRARS
jgi:predicted alpha/beta superfamily hydrolase